MQVAGVDAWKSQWVGVLLNDGAFQELRIFKTLANVMRRWGRATHVVVDIPFGLPLENGINYPRAADTSARAFLPAGSRQRVFDAPPRQALMIDDYKNARVTCAALGVDLRPPAHGLRRKMLEANAVKDCRLYEGHPEVSFAAMSSTPGRELPPKTTWNGQHERLQLLHDQGIVLPGTLGVAGRAHTEDILDACAMAWTASRIEGGSSGTFPASPPKSSTGHTVAIHY